MAPNSFVRQRLKPKIPVYISHEVVKDVPNSANDQISLLPNEVQSKIFQSLEDPADKTAFALTCKILAQMYRHLGQASIIDTKTIMRSKYAEGKRLEYFRRLITWRPMKKYRLCTCCHYFFPFTQAGWTGDSKWYERKLNLKAARIQGSRCTNCALKVERDVAKIRRMYAKPKRSK